MAGTNGSKAARKPRAPREDRQIVLDSDRLTTDVFTMSREEVYRKFGGSMPPERRKDDVPSEAAPAKPST